MVRYCTVQMVKSTVQYGTLSDYISITQTLSEYLSITHDLSDYLNIVAIVPVHTCIGTELTPYIRV